MNLVDKYGLDDPPSKFRLKKSELVTATLAINLLSLALPVMVLQVYDRILANRSDGTLVVQPITKIVYGDECRGAVNNRFEYRAKFNQVLPAGEYLLHVRVLDGNSVNQFLSID